MPFCHKPAGTLGISQPACRSLRWVIVLATAMACYAPQTAWSEDDSLTSLLVARCVKCHGDEKPKAEINLRAVSTPQQLLAHPDILQRLVEVVDANEMPPESEPAIDAATRRQMLDRLKSLLRESVTRAPRAEWPLRRLNRFQYNNTVRDLLQLNRDLFELPEKLITRHDPYLRDGAMQMPLRVHVASQALKPAAGFSGLKPFPKDLRAEHGYDNQANQLTLSPLLLEQFLRLSVSLVESPDFNPQNVGMWQAWFAAPDPQADLTAEIHSRVQSLLRRAFRMPVDAATVERYTRFALTRTQAGLPFTESMKRVVSAVLSSPSFLYRVPAQDDKTAQYELASNLSYFLWSSGPDEALLQLAERGEFANREALERTIDRMLRDPKIERFLDSFPSQWLQLENVLASTPDPSLNRFYGLDPEYPASLQMVVEPLLLFDAMFIENRPLAQFIAPPFAYRSEFLQRWYFSDLTAPRVDLAAIQTENKRREEQRAMLKNSLADHQRKLAELIDPVREKLIAARKAAVADQPPVDLKPYAAWEFNTDLRDTVGGLHLTAHGNAELKDGAVRLKQSYLQSTMLPIDLKAKTLEVWCQVHQLDERGGGVMGIQGPGDFFDTIVLGERKPRHWISGSNVFARTDDFAESVEESKRDQWLYLAMVYAADGTTTLYRDGKPYGQPFNKGGALFPREQTSVLFGLRHLPPGGNKFLTVTIDRARLYDRALTAEEVAASASGMSFVITDRELREALTVTQAEQYTDLLKSIELAQTTLNGVPANRDATQEQQQAERRFEEDVRREIRSNEFSRVPIDDPRFGGVITNAAMATMNSGPKRTHPIARGAWIIGVIFNDPPPPPPNDVPPLNEDDSAKDQTIREKFASHRSNPSCAGCHQRIDPLGFAMENYDITGRWRDRYENGKPVNASGTLLRQYEFSGIQEFKAALVREDERFARAFTSHLLRFALGRSLTPADSLTVDAIVAQTSSTQFPLREVIRAVAVNMPLRQSK
ncbi:MAG: hypothetical protein RIS70_2224 [Planctomycetota bacterium]